MDKQILDVLESQNPWWFGREFTSGVDRLDSYPRLREYLKAPEIMLILGVRRGGKSTIAYQLVKKLLMEDVPAKSILYMNLDEPILENKSDDPVFLRETIGEHMSHNPKEDKYYIFVDEVQLNNHWAHTAKVIYDTEKKAKLILTGSTSTLIQSEGSTRLSGRYFQTTIYPLTFTEYLRFRGANKPTRTETRLHFEEYLKYGGFPRVVLEESTSLKEDLLKNYYQAIYMRDIILPKKIKNNKELFDLLYYIISNPGKQFSYKKVGEILGMDTKTVQEYINHAEEAYLLTTTTKYDKSVRKQAANQKKIYCADTGLINAVSFRFREEKGRLLENLTHQALKRRYDNIYYHKGQHECDFLVKEGLKITQAIQVTLTMKDPETKTREMKGLLEAMETHKLKEGLIITENENRTITIDGKKITVKPAHQWLLENTQ